MLRKLLPLLVCLGFLAGCNIQDIPPAHKAWVFEESALGSSKGFAGPILNPGSQDIGVNNSYRMIQCSESTVREDYTSPAKDGVEFGIDIYTRYAANCNEDDAIKWILQNVQPNPKQVQDVATSDKKTDDSKKAGEAPVDGRDADRTVTAFQLHATYLRPLMGEAVRDAISGYNSDEINAKRDEIITKLSKNFNDRLKKTFDDAKRPQIILVYEITLSKIDFPDKMMELNQQLANRKTEIRIEEENKRKVTAQIETERQQKDLEKVKSEKSVQEIELVGKIIRENPEYLEYLRVKQQPEVFGALGKGGGTFIMGGGSGMPSLMLGPKSGK